MIKRLLYGIFISVLLSNLALASDARLSGMGNLSLIFQDDLHKLDLYDFARISAGFFGNDTTSSVAFRASGLQESWGDGSYDYLAIGQAIPQSLIDYIPIEAVAYFGVVPQFSLVPCELIYVSRNTEEKHDFFGGKISPQAYGVYAGYSQLKQKYDFAGNEIENSVMTPSLGIVYARPISDNLDFGISGDGFYSSLTTAGSDDRISLIPFGGGMGMSYNSEVLTLGLNGDYHYSMFRYKGAFADEKFNGHAISPSVGSLVKLANISWVSTFNYKLLNQKGTSDGNDLGNLKANGYSAKSQILFTPAFARLTGFAQHDYSKPTFTDANDSSWYEVSFRNYSFGGGIGIDYMPIKAGFEGLYALSSGEDLLTQQTTESNALSLRAGAEFNVLNTFFIRAGYDYDQFDPDQDDTNDQTNANTITGGLGFNFSGLTRIDLAYNYKWTEMETMPDENVTDHIVFLYMKSILKSKSF